MNSFDCETQDFDERKDISSTDGTSMMNNACNSQSIFSDNLNDSGPTFEKSNGSNGTNGASPSAIELKERNQGKRKLSDDSSDSNSKHAKIETIELKDTQTIDDEINLISSNEPVLGPRTPRKFRSNSTEQVKTPRTPRSRTTSEDKKTVHSQEIYISSDSSSRPSVEFIKEIRAKEANFKPIAEEPSLNDSQDFHLVLSPSPEEEAKVNCSSDPVVPKDRQEVLDPGKQHQTRSEGYNYSDQSTNLSQPRMSREQATDQESTDSAYSIVIESPDHPTVASKLISTLSNGNSSTPTEQIPKNVISLSDTDNTPDMVQLNDKNRGKIDNFRVSNTTTPSTISPFQNGHSIPMATPQIPVFDVHVNHGEDGDFLSLYIVRTDNDLGMDMCKEYQRFSKRFTIDPYLGDVSNGNSPSSVTSTGMINLPNRTSFASTISSNSSSSNRTSDGNFVVPQPPRKSISHPANTTVKGCEALIKKVQEVLSHIDDVNRSVLDDKVSIGIQASPSFSNGAASPEEISKCDKATPKSSLKKRVRGRRPFNGKTKRAILPTQNEEPELLEAINSPEVVTIDGKMSPQPDDNKPLSLMATPKSVSRLKGKKRAQSPRPVTPVDKPKLEYNGYPPDTVVLAKWVDKRYYSGRVVEQTDPNKYVIKFDDGQSKTLIDDFIIFGNYKSLPLEGQSLYALVDEDLNYEPGLVLGVEENDAGTVIYRCTTDGDTTVSVTATELYLTEDQAKSIKETKRPNSPHTPTTPRRRGLRELDLDNIITGPRSARTRDKGTPTSRKRITSPKSPKASTSGIKSKIAFSNRKRVLSESSEISENSNSCSGTVTALEEVPGVEPEVQKTPRKVPGVKAGPLLLKGAAKQNLGKKNSKLAKFTTEEDVILGPIPKEGSKLFDGLHFLLTCTDPPKRSWYEKPSPKKTLSSTEEEGDTSAAACTDTEDLEFSSKPFNKERLKEQLEAGGGLVYSNFDELPRNKYDKCKLIAPRPCLTAKYIQCLAAKIKALSHDWVISSCVSNVLADMDAFVLPTGFSVLRQRFATWDSLEEGSFKNKLIVVSGEQEDFVKFWERICTLVGANTRIVSEDDMNLNGAYALLADCDCSHQVQNKANMDKIPIVSTHWLVQSLIEGKILPTACHDKFSFMYAEPE